MTSPARKAGTRRCRPRCRNFPSTTEKWIASPVNVHSTNWVWANKEVLAKAGVTSETEDLGRIHGGGAESAEGRLHCPRARWSAMAGRHLFDGVAISTGGVDYYRKALIDLDQKTINSPTTEKVFQRMSQLRKLVDKDFSGRDWNVASGMVISGKAGFQMMGDWAKGEFINAKKVPGKDFLCFRTPGTQGVFLQLRSIRNVQGRRRQVGGAGKAGIGHHGPGLSIGVNVVKGSVPARTDVPDTAFDACGKKGMKDLAEANKNNTLVGSMAMAMPCRPRSRTPSMTSLLATSTVSSTTKGGCRPRGRSEAVSSPLNELISV